MPVFTYLRRVHYHECDRMGIIYNSYLYAYFDEALRELARVRPELAAALPGMEPGGGANGVVTQARLRFLKPVRFGDDIEIEVEGEGAAQGLVVWNLTVTLSGSKVAEGSIETKTEDEERLTP